MRWWLILGAGLALAGCGPSDEPNGAVREPVDLFWHGRNDSDDFIRIPGFRTLSDCTTVPPLLEKTLQPIVEAGARTPPDRSAEIFAARLAQEACVHRWAYRLARSRDTAEVVARAAFAVCDTAPAYGITRRAVLYQEAGEALDFESYRQRQTRELTDLALFHVVQARAGRCPVPE